MLHVIFSGVYPLSDVFMYIAGDDHQLLSIPKCNFPFCIQSISFHTNRIGSLPCVFVLGKVSHFSSGRVGNTNVVEGSLFASPETYVQKNLA